MASSVIDTFVEMDAFTSASLVSLLMRRREASKLFRLLSTDDDPGEADKEGEKVGLSKTDGVAVFGEG